MDFYTLVERIIQVSMVVFPVSPYYSQYKKIKYDPNGRKGFSRHVCGFLLMANIFKIFFWIGKRFDVTLLCQAIAMFTVQFILLHASKLDVRIIYLKTGKEWIYKSFTLYLVLIIMISFILSILGHFFNDSYIYLEIIGFIGVSIEASVPIPQAIRNYKNKSVKGFSKVVLIVWYTGDTCKVCYHGFMHTPHQFFICGLFQLFMDVVITSQWIHYSKSGNSWYDRYARKYGLYYENNDLLDDDDSCNDYSCDENNQYKKYKELSTPSGNEVIVSSTSSDITTESSQETIFNNNRQDNNNNNEIYTYIAPHDKQENEKYLSPQNKKVKEEIDKNSKIKSYSENKNSDISCNLNHNNTNQNILRKNSQNSTKSNYSSDGIEGSDTFVEKESDIIDQKLYSISSSSSHESNHICKKSKITSIDKEMKIIYKSEDDIVNMKDDKGMNKDTTTINNNKKFNKINNNGGSNSDDDCNYVNDNIDISKSDHHNISTTTVKSKHALSSKRSRENYGIDKYIFDYLQDEYSKLNPSLNEISFKKMSTTTTNNNNTKNSQSLISTTTKHNNNVVIPIPNDFIDNPYSIKRITTIKNKVKTIVKKKNLSLSNLKNEKSNKNVEELKTPTNLPNSTQSNTNATNTTTINTQSDSSTIPSSIKSDNATISIDNFSDTEQNSKNTTNNNLNNKNNITININNNILKIKSSDHSIFSAPAIIDIPLYSQHEPPEFSILLSDHPNVHNKINKKLNTSLTKTSTLSNAINNSKALNTVSSIFTFSFSSGLSKINNKLQNTKKAKAKADAEAAFQAEIDMAFDGDDFERDIRDGIGFKSLKNKSFNRKKESNSGTSHDAETETQGIDFNSKLQNWTGFVIKEVV